MIINRLKVIRVFDRVAWPTLLLMSNTSSLIRRKQVDGLAIVRPGGMGDLICVQIALEQLELHAKDYCFVIEKRAEAWAKHAGLNYVLISGRLIGRVGRYSGVVNTEQKYGVSQIISQWIKATPGILTSFSTVRGWKVSDALVPYSPYRCHESQLFAELISLALELPICSSTVVRKRKQPEIHASKLVVAIGGNHSASRKLSVEQWDALIRRWSSGCKVDLVAGPLEYETAKGLVALDPLRRSFTVRSFDEMCGEIAGAARVLANDGGLVHVASFYGVPTDALFTSGIEKKWGPLGIGSTVVYDRELKCHPCTTFGNTPECSLHHECKNALVLNLRPI